DYFCQVWDRSSTKYAVF
nr:immunoglobulin light chain junction region [Macaca mulatta]MOV94936.1 immunoglobulin light chain junction region [Macaca mulatta]MOV95142.1 immunoglobulin light chain junction region [Macaca mulatta]MOV95823.1 immunoglobulin light chain junction region [Macaca mulatta]MOV97798.1 immunoglobulin light chain junction region [Macaca mulatta]